LAAEIGFVSQGGKLMMQIEGLARRRRRNRRRNTVRAGGLVAFAAAVTAMVLMGTAAIAAPVSPGHATAHASTRIPPGTTAYPRADIVRTSAIYAPWSHYKSRYFRRISLQRGGRNSTLYKYLSGKRAETLWSEAYHKPLQVLVDYKNRTWERGKTVPGAANLPPVVAADYFETFQTRHHCEVFIWFLPIEVTNANIRDYVHCGGVRIAGHQRIDGTETVKILPTVHQHRLYEAIWISTSSHLPVQLAIRTRTSAFVAEMTFLPPTKANLALLKPVIPRGYRRVR
jgi:hypothetical protein